MSRRLRWWVSGALAVAVLAAAAGYLSHHFPRTGAGSSTFERQSIRFGLARQPTASLAAIACSEGFLAEEGLDVAVKTYASGKLSLDGLLAGEVDFATPAETPLVFANFNRSDMAVVATIGHSDNDYRVVARRDRGIQRPEDLRGKRIGVQEKSAAHFFLHCFHLRHGLSEESVRICFLPVADLAQALADGRIDAYATREPFVDEGLRRLGDNAVVFAEPGIYREMQLVVTVRKTAAENPDTVARVLRALIRAERLAAEDPQRAVASASRALGISQPVLSRVWPDLVLRVLLEQGLLLAMEDEARWAIASHLTDRTEVPNYLSIMHGEVLHDIRPDGLTVFH